MLKFLASSLFYVDSVDKFLKNNTFNIIEIGE